MELKELLYPDQCEDILVREFREFKRNQWYWWEKLCIMLVLNNVCFLYMTGVHLVNRLFVLIYR